MNKKIWVGVAFAALIIVGAVFASAGLKQKETVEDADESAPSCAVPQTCGSGTCNFQCGGNCGIPGCGCGK